MSVAEHSHGPAGATGDPSAPPVTFVLFAYNQGATVREACLSALAQDYSPLEIIFSDDASTDATWAVMQEVAAGYRGPHTLRLNRNPLNLGLIAHVNEAMRLSSGELVVAAAGDDVSLPDRTTALVAAWIATGRKANSIHSSVTRIDPEGRPDGVWTPPILALSPDVESMALSFSLIIGASHAWTRRVFDVFGPITERETYEDLVIAFRSLLLGPIAYVDRPLVRYRVGLGMSAAPPLATSMSQHRAQLVRRTRLRAATLAQRCTDCYQLGRDVPRALRRAAAFEAARRDFLVAGTRGIWETLRRRPTEAGTLIRAWLSTANALRRARRRLGVMGRGRG